MPATDSRIYLDYNATAPLHPAVRAAMEPWLGPSLIGNPSSIHAEGRRARAALDNARDRIAALLSPNQGQGKKVRPGELIFTSGGTESDNLALRGLAQAHEHATKGRHLITAATEHHAVLETCEALAKEGFQLTLLPVDTEGRVHPATLEKNLRPDTLLVSVMTANNETGVIQPTASLAALCAQRGILFHTDAVQSTGKEPLPTTTEAAPHLAAMSLAAHKFGGPPGIGLLWLRSGLPLAKLLHGGSQENARRPGTENVAAIVGMAEALALAEAARETEHPRQLALTERLWQGLRDLPGARRNTPTDPALRIANTLNLSFGEGGLHGEELLIALDLAGLALSSGSACLVGSIRPSHVLAAMAVPETAARATLRFSLGKETTADEIEETIKRVREVVLRQAALARK